MRLVFYTSRKDRRIEFAEKFAAGVRKHGDIITCRRLDGTFEQEPHVGVLIGNKLRHHMKPLTDRQLHVIYLDKAYPSLVNGGFPRNSEYVRVTLDGSHPTDYLTELGKPDDRRRLFDWHATPWRTGGKYVLFAGAGRAFYQRLGIEDISGHILKIVQRLQAGTKRPVIFRAKPNMPKDVWSKSGREGQSWAGPLENLLPDCHVVAVEDSALCLQALLLGVPSLVLPEGNAPTKPISSRQFDEVNSPFLAPKELVESFLNDLAYFQYSPAEYESGTAWEFLRFLWFRGRE
jgi:hypothetical protein